jgi:hypothetical protein
MDVSILVQKFENLKWEDELPGSGQYGRCFAGELEKYHGRGSHWDRISVGVKVLHTNALRSHEQQTMFLRDVEFMANEHPAVQSLVISKPSVHLNCISLIP